MLLAVGPALDVYGRDSPADAAECRAAPVCGAASLRALRRDRYVVIDGVLSGAELRDAHAACVALHAQSPLAPTSQDAADARTDRVTWVEDDGASPPAIVVALRRLRGVADELDSDARGRGAWLGFDGDVRRRGSRRSRPLGVPAAAQLARYGVDASGYAQRYAAHRDGAPLSELGPPPLAALIDATAAFGARDVTAILYLNGPAWAADGNGGELVLYAGAAADDDTGATAAGATAVRPVGGRLVLFDARTVLHEVRPHRLPGGEGRFALTLWLGGAHLRK